MKPKSVLPKPKSILPDIKKGHLSPKQVIQYISKFTKPSPKLSSSRISRQSSTIETTISTTEPIKKSNRNNVEQLVKNKSYFNHRALMNDYLKRLSVPISTKIFIYNSQDEHIRRCLLKHGWIENFHQSPMFDLKWVCNDALDDYKTLLDGQFYNHFKNNNELTSKQSLLVNFKNQAEYGLDTSHFFPRAYDLGNLNDREDFIREYERTCITVILRKCVKYLKQTRKQLCDELKLEILAKWKQKQELRKIRNGKIDLIRQVHRKYKVEYIGEQLQADQQYQCLDLKLDLQIMAQVLSKLSDMKRQLRDGYYEDRCIVEMGSMQQLRMRNKLLKYSQIDKFTVGSTPNRFLIEKLIGYHLFLKQHDPSYRSDGIDNIWIIKPSGCARGQGIYLEQDVSEAITSGMQMQARLIQKYIEKPLLYNKHKFDLRQWVLVTSVQPLRAYVFSHCYMRMCSQPYDLRDTKNLLRHLTNFSLNKTAFTDQNDSIYSSDHLEQYLKSNGVDWQGIVRPQINDIIVKTLKIVQEQYDGESKYSFELYGFDIMLDYKYKPWLLEVNLSPACTERATWLSEMLDCMSDSMFNIIYGSPFTQPTKYKYELLIDEEYPSLQCNQDAQLEIMGNKCNYKREKIIDKKYYEYLSTLTIQKFFRMFLAQKQLRFLRNTKYSIIIQKYVRRYLAIQLKSRLKHRKCAIIIQCLIRTYLAKQQRYRLKQKVSATNIQCMFRQRQARKIREYLYVEHNAMILQSLFRCRIAKNLAIQQLTNLSKFKKISRWWKSVYRYRNAKSTRIQQTVRCYLQTKRYAKLLIRHRSAIKIQSQFKQYKAIRIRQILRIEQSALLLQCLLRNKLALKRITLMKMGDGLSRFVNAYNHYMKRQVLIRLNKEAIQRDKAIVRIQSYRLVLKCKRFLKRLKRLKRLIKLQATIKMHVQRKRYRLIVRRHRAIVKLMKAIRRFIFRKKIKRRIQISRKSNNNNQQIQQFVKPQRKLVMKKQ